MEVFGASANGSPRMTLELATDAAAIHLAFWRRSSLHLLAMTGKSSRAWNCAKTAALKSSRSNYHAQLQTQVMFHANASQRFLQVQATARQRALEAPTLFFYGAFACGLAQECMLPVNSNTTKGL